MTASTIADCNFNLLLTDKPTIEVQDAVPDSETEERVTAETNVEASSFGIIVTVIVISLLLVSESCHPDTDFVASDIS